MGTGASSARRKAKSQATIAYYNALRKIKPIEGAQERKIARDSARELEDSLGGDVSFSTKRLARQADKLAGTLNKLQPKFKESVDAYNKRYEILQKQMVGRHGTTVDLGEYTVEKRNTNANSILGAADKFMQGEKPEQVFSSLDDAKQFALKNTPKVDARTGLINATLQGMQGQRQNNIADLVQNKNTVGDFELKKKTYGGISTVYDFLPNNEAAYKDMERLSNDVANSGTNKQYTQAANQYQEIAQKLKSKLRREDGMVKQNNPTGLLGQDVISGNSSPVASETLR